MKAYAQCPSKQVHRLSSELKGHMLSHDSALADERSGKSPLRESDYEEDGSESDLVDVRMPTRRPRHSSLFICLAASVFPCLSNLFHFKAAGSSHKDERRKQFSLTAEWKSEKQAIVRTIDANKQHTRGTSADTTRARTWQKSNHRNCNMFHEIDFRDNLSIVGEGGKRHVWKYSEYDGSLKALKTFRYRRDKEDDFGPASIELQRRDAVIHEITSSSPYTVDIHGYCSTSAIYEFGEGGQMLENVMKDGPIAREDLLRIAHHVASSVADVHHYDDSGKPAVAHNDIHGQQWIKVKGEYKLTDMNFAKFLKRSATTNETIPFNRITSANANWFAPEVHLQVHTNKSIVTDKADIWNMGSIFYLMLVGRPPFHWLKRPAVHSMILNHDVTPMIDRVMKRIELKKGEDSVYQTMIRTIKMCMKENPKHRPSARNVAKFLEAHLANER